jgi:hypothetical protein
MINYYYELNDNVKVFGHEDLRYLSITDLKPSTVGWRHLHEEAHKNSRRVWLENANGVTLVKAPVDDRSWGQVNEQELTWLKLICKDIESL